MYFKRFFPALFIGASALLLHCVGDQANPTACAPKSCTDVGAECGTQSDGCGGALECGVCEGGTCNAGKCGCVAKTCPDLKVQCGKVADGCGTDIDCGGCANVADSCNTQTHVCECKPKDCTALGVECGVVPDGCGGTVTCGTCANNPNGPNCNAGKCGAAACTPKTCQGLGKNCDQVSDGCGAILNCGPCTSPQTCGGSGTANVCGCTPKTCFQLGASCGPMPDQCGGTLNCGSCVSPKSCGGGGTAHQCGCTPDKCEIGDCGVISNGCGGSINCGICPCFVATTQILMGDGTMRAIETIHRGDVVMAYDEKTGQTAPRPVDHLATHGESDSASGLVLVNDSIRATRNHPFFVDGRRVRAEDLKVGDVMRTAVVDHGTVTLRNEPVTSVSVVAGNVATYDVVTAPAAGYFVGPRHLLVLIKVPQ